MDDIISERLAFLKSERIEHANASAYPTIQDDHEYHSADGEYSFKHEDDARYYETLTGHIEELQFLIAYLDNQ